MARRRSRTEITVPEITVQCVGKFVVKKYRQSLKNVTKIAEITVETIENAHHMCGLQLLLQLPD